MWYFHSLSREENPGRDFDCGKCNIYKGMVHYAMITSGIGIAKKANLGDWFNYKAACHNFKYVLFKAQMDTRSSLPSLIL